MRGLTVAEVGQWQGSSAPGAALLRDGAGQLAGLVPGTALVTVPVTGTAGNTSGGVRHADVLAANLAAVRAAIARAGDSVVVTAGGDCGVELAPIDAVHRAYGGRLAVAWLDAHADLNTPQSSPSGAFHGMVLRALLGEGPPGLRPDRPLTPAQVVLAGTRALDPGEREFVRRKRIRRLGVADLADQDALADAVVATGAGAVYVHVDLDVLDPGEFASVGCPEPGGLTVARLAAAVTALAERVTIAGLGITEYQPAGPRDQEALARLTASLADAVTASQPERLRRIEEHAARAWPAEIAREAGGWLLRRTPGVSRRRSNSALPPWTGPAWPATAGPALTAGAGLGAAIGEVEEFYARHGLPVAIQVSPAGRHRELDEVLAARGYRRTAPTLVLAARPATVAGRALAGRDLTGQARAAGRGPSGGIAVDLAGKLPDWLAAFGELDEHSDSETVAERVIGKIALPVACASVRLDGQVAGIGLVAGGLPGGPVAGLFCVATRPAHRRRGVAAAMTGAAARWAADQGVELLYLQVEEDNLPARRLYATLGFTLSHRYHFRVAGAPPATARA